MVGLATIVIFIGQKVGQGSAFLAAATAYGRSYYMFTFINPVLEMRCEKTLN